MADRPLLASCLAEVLGTFLLVLFGCGAVHVAVLLGDLNGLWQVGIVWGTAIMLAIYVVGPISGAHINPAITVGMAAWGLFPRARVMPYMLSQLAGAFLAAATLFFLFSSYLTAKEEAKGVRRGDSTMARPTSYRTRASSTAERGGRRGTCRRCPGMWHGSSRCPSASESPSRVAPPALVPAPCNNRAHIPMVG